MGDAGRREEGGLALVIGGRYIAKPDAIPHWEWSRRSDYARKQAVSKRKNISWSRIFQLWVSLMRGQGQDAEERLGFVR